MNFSARTAKTANAGTPGVDLTGRNCRFSSAAEGWHRAGPMSQDRPVWPRAEKI